VTITGTRRVDVLRWRECLRHAGEDTVAEEVPVAFLYNDSAFAVMLASPTDLEDFALGFSLGEAVVGDPSEFRLVECRRDRDSIALHAAIPQPRFDALAERRRALSGRGGCGLCGQEWLTATDGTLPSVTRAAPLPVAWLYRGLEALQAQQLLNGLTGGVHAAAWVGQDDLLLREDIGRHNAVDKLVGALAHGQRRNGLLLVTSRASYEIVLKAARANIAVVAAISAPTSLAIDLAQRSGITLIGFARGESLTVYSHPAGLD